MFADAVVGIVPLPLKSQSGWKTKRLKAQLESTYYRYFQRNSITESDTPLEEFNRCCSFYRVCANRLLIVWNHDLSTFRGDNGVIRFNGKCVGRVTFFLQIKKVLLIKVYYAARQFEL